VLGVSPAVPGRLSDPEQLRLLESFANQTALALERAALAEEAQQAWMKVEAELMRNTLLSSVSHDLRTPLAAITGAASSLLSDNPSLPADARRELAQTVADEAERMERLINNLLDMTRLESGGLYVHKEWQPLQELIGAALRHSERRLDGRPVHVDVPADLPLAQLDAVSVEQVLLNLLDNAVEHTPPGTPIDITGRATREGVTVEVADRGPGLPDGTEERIFQKFFRGPSAGSRRGIGLGLSISRGLIEAHGGTIHAANRPGGGATFRFTLPSDGTPPPAPSE